MTERYKAKKKTSPVKAIREMCIECMGGRDSKGYKKLIETRKSETCALYDFRFGTDPHRNKMELSDEERNARSDRARNNFSTVIIT